MIPELPLQTLGLHHVGIAVSNLDVGIERYSTALGATIDVRASVEDQGVEAASLHVADSLVELLAPLGPDTTVARFIERRGEGLHHLAYAVADVAAALEACRSEGLRLIDEMPRIGLHGTNVAFLHPSVFFGTLVELVETHR
jgi:methylmalonyl-CoA/ethylmalonyl-CoA epimerase